MRQCIKNNLNYTYKKVYFRSYSKDEQSIKETRFWLASVLFENNNFYTDKYMVWMDESAINNTSYK